MKTLNLFSIVALLVVLFSAKSFAQDSNEKATAKAESMKTQFSLSDEQTKSLQTLFVTIIDKETALYASGKSRLEVEAGKDEIHTEFYNGVKTIFTEDQFAKFDAPDANPEEGAKWRALKYQKSLGLTDEQKQSLYDLIVSTTKLQAALVKPAEGDRTDYYNSRIKIDDDFYAAVKVILTPDQFSKFDMYDY